MGKSRDKKWFDEPEDIDSSYDRVYKHDRRRNKRKKKTEDRFYQLSPQFEEEEKNAYEPFSKR